MSSPVDPILLIPARLHATRLPGKPLADIHGEPMIVHVWRRARETGLGRVVVACGEPEIAAAVHSAGGEAVLTDPSLPSGSDRIFAALQAIDPAGRHDAVINIQGDLPLLDSGTVHAALTLLDDPAVDVGTVACRIIDQAECDRRSVVKAVVAWRDDGRRGRALYFTRAPAPSGRGPMFHHIGLYAYRRPALQRFVTLSPSPLEKQERLEQLRALEAGMRVDVARVDTIPLGIDTPADLERVRTILKT